MISLARTLDAVSPRIPPALVGPAAFRRARAVADHLPAALTTWTYLECRLGPRPAPVDLIVEVDAQGRSILTGDNPPLALDGALLAHPAWARVADLCREWADPASPLHRTVDCLWLEFDVAEGPAALPVPGVFAGLTPVADALPPEERGALALRALEILRGGEVPAATRRAFLRSFLHLPDGARMMHVGLLVPRGVDALRVCPAGIPLKALSGYLRAVEWTGDGAQLAAVTSTLDRAREDAAGRDPGIAHLDVGARVLPRIGLEYGFERRAQMRGRLAEAHFAEALVREGLCAPEKAAALAEWPGWSMEQLPHELWRSLVIRRANHVKVVLEAGRAPEAKGYLCIHHRFWRSRASARIGAEAGETIATGSA